MPLKERDMISMSDPRVAQIGHPAPPWMVNYADLMTELVCFFVILYALSAALNKDVQEAKKQVEETMKQEQIRGDVKVDKDGMHITITEQGENVYFESGRADLSPRLKQILKQIGPSMMPLAKEGHDIIVEGHTDDVPIHNQHFTSNWELSTARATNVVRHMIRANGFPPGRMAAIGYGEYRPMKANVSAENRAANRRVVFFIKNKPVQPKEKKKKASEEEPAAEDEAAMFPAGEKPAAAAEPEGSSESAYAEAPAGEPTTDNALPLPRDPPSD